MYPNGTEKIATNRTIVEAEGQGSGLDQIARLYPNLPVVLTSGYSEVLAQNGTYGFELVHKPYSIDSLSRALRKVARRK